MSLNRIDASLASINTDIRDIDRKLDGVDRKAESASSAVSGLPDVHTHIRETSVFIGETNVRIEHLTKSSVTKAQLAGWALTVIVAAVSGLFAAGWWLTEKYLVPILERLPIPPH